jgi:hypothetical protein
MRAAEAEGTQHQPAWRPAGSDPPPALPRRPPPKARASPPHRRPPPTPDAPADPDRAALLARWLDLTRRVLPGMAAAQRWPIRLDHCFMRVCLDAAFGRPWHEAVRRPAVRHMTETDLARAIAVAERIAAVPSLLSGLNAESLRLRGKAGPRRRPGAP